MTSFEYKVVPAPMRGLKGKGIKGTQARFANALQTVMNDLGGDGWEYQRTDTLPVEERQGLTGKTTSFQNMLVFRRTVEDVVEDAPEIAALIEDQSDVLADAEDHAPEIEETPEDIAATAEDLVGELPQDSSADAPVTLAAQDRVAETLKAPFAFPWNRRDTGSSQSKPDSNDNNIPAE